MEKVRERIESLVVHGMIAPAAARRDLRTLGFLEDHPDRGLPSSWADWITEWRLAIINTSDPGPFQILRVRLLAGEVEAKDLGRVLRRSALVSGALCAILLFLVMGVLLVPILAFAGAFGWGANRYDVESALRILAMFAQYCGLSGFVFGSLVWGLSLWEIRSLIQALKAVDQEGEREGTP